EITPSSAGALDGHVKNDPEDIIPPFTIIENGVVVVDFPGRNMNTLYDGFTGAEVLANHCDIPTSGGGITQTVTTTLTQAVPVPATVAEPATTFATPGLTTTTVLTVTLTGPSQTVTNAVTTVVTVPSGATTTVTLPSATVTLPAVTATIPGGTVERDPVTVTL